MDRGASAGFLTELAQANNSPIYLVDVYFDGGTDRMTNAFKNISIAGNTYYALGYFLGFSGLSETEGMNIPSVTVRVSGIDQSRVAVMLSTPFLDLPLVISKTFIDATGQVTITPVVIFDGRMDGMSTVDDPEGTTTVSIVATNQFTDFDFAAGRHTNMAEQQVFFPDDLFFQYASSVTPEITWGVK